MRWDWLAKRQTKFGVYVVLYTAMVAVALVIVNFLANRHNWSYDATANKRYSLSEQTQKIIRNLDRDVKIRYFDQTSRFEGAKDLLDRYDRLSPRVTVEYIDPDKKPQLARQAGITTYGTILVEAGGRREEAKFLTEEEVTNALIRALKGGQKTVCAVAGSGEHSFDDTGRTGYSTLKDLIEKANYKTKTISLLEKPEVPSDCSILLVGGPRFDYLPPAVEAIKKYVESGGSAIFLLDPPVQLGREQISENPELLKLLENWGVKLNKDLIVDTSGIGSLFGLSEVVPLVSDYEFHPIVRDMRNIATAFPLARSIDIEQKGNITVEKLFSTTSRSYVTTKLNAAEIEIDPNKAKRGPFTLGVAGTVPVKQEEKKAQADEARPAGESSGEASQQPTKKEARFVVVGSSGWVANNFVRFNGNRDLFLNMLNWLSADEDLISIRPKEPEDRRLTLSRQQMARIFWSTVVGLPLVIIVAGVVVWWRRR